MAVEKVAAMTAELRDLSAKVEELADDRTLLIRSLHDEDGLTFADIARQAGVTAQAIAKAYGRRVDDE